MPLRKNLIKPIFTESFPSFGAADAGALALLIQRIVRPSCRTAEIGSWLGAGSTQVFLRELAACPEASLLCVDTWQGSPGVQRHCEIAEKYDVLGTFRENTARHGIRLQALIADSSEAATMIADGFFDLVFLDADHRYEAVRRDITAWLPKLRPGGILCGHDCECRPADAPSPMPTDREIDFIEVEKWRFQGFHPGCVAAVDEVLRGSAQLFAEESGELGASTIWFFQGER